MYPQSPTVQQWRATGAKAARASGVPVPDWFTGSDESARRLNSETPDLMAAVNWFMQDYAASNPGEFPENFRTAADAFLAKNPTPAGFTAGRALESYGIGAMAGDFVKEALWTGTTPAQDAFIDGAVSAAGELVKSPGKLLKGPAAVKADPKGFLTVAIAGIALGAGAWYFLGRRGA